jgi:phage terminase small subunit
MTPRQERFCQEYMVDLNGTQAATRAGYSKRTANEQAARLLADVSVAARVAELKRQMAEKTQVTIERWHREVALIAFSTMADYATVDDDGNIRVDVGRSQAETMVAIQQLDQSVEMIGNANDGLPIRRTRLKLHDKLKALDLIAKANGYYAPKTVNTVATDADGKSLEQITEELHASMRRAIECAFANTGEPAEAE